MEQLFFLSLHCLFAYLIARLGEKRNIGFGWSFFFAFILSPIIGLIIVLCSGKKRPTFIEVSKDTTPSEKQFTRLNK